MLWHAVGNTKKLEQLVLTDTIEETYEDKKKGYHSASI